ncbi:hypothetical protein V9L05_17415 [Bernardetia sp. Wsw4-3y2]|uniref:hypothetical protein n=1 Tax=Bernardetia sp. Wsw4-3y2 TaxID=3127471 RepID=UPI0030D2F4F5
MPRIMLKNLNIFSLFFLLGLLTIALSSYEEATPNFYTEDQITGKWFAKEIDNSIIEVSKNSNQKWQGKIIKSDNKETIGKTIFLAEYQSKDKNYTGTLYKPDGDIEVAATLTLLSSQKLKVVGKKFFMSKTFYFTKTN